MAKSPNQKYKLLYLLQILTQESDELHPLSIQQIIEALARYEIAAERKSVYDDIAILIDFGYDIVVQKGRSNTYFLGSRDFELVELKLLVDAVESAKFITAKKSQSLIQKICHMTSKYQAQLMQRQVHVQDRAKTFNELTYYNVDTIHSAIAQNRQIQFRYYSWVVDPASPKLFARKARRGGAYTVSPWSLLWDDEYYYLIAYDPRAQHIKHYRIDRMEQVTVCKSHRDGQKAFLALDIAQYSKSMFGMFGGAPTSIRLRMHNRLIGIIVDRFGTDIIIHKSGPDHFIIHANVIVSPQFYSWLLGFETEAQVLSPDWVVDSIRDKIQAIDHLYKKPE